MPDPVSSDHSPSHSPASNTGGGPLSGALSHSPLGASASRTQPPHSSTPSTVLADNRPLNVNDISFQVIGKQPSLLLRLSDPKAMNAPYRSPSPIPSPGQSSRESIQPPLSRPSLLECLSKPSPSASGNDSPMRSPERMETPFLRYPESEGRPSVAPDTGGQPSTSHSIATTSVDADSSSKTIDLRLSPKKESSLSEHWPSHHGVPNGDSAPAQTPMTTTSSEQNAPSSSQLYDLLDTHLQRFRSNWEASPLPTISASLRQDTRAQSSGKSPQPANDPAALDTGTMVLHQSHAQFDHLPSEHGTDLQPDSTGHSSLDHAMVIAPPSQSLASSRTFEEHTAVFVQLAEAMHRDAQANTRNQAQAERELAERWQSIENCHRFLDDKQQTLEENERRAREDLEKREAELHRKEEETAALQRQLREAEVSHRQIESELRAKGQELAELENTWREKMRELDATSVFVKEVLATAEAKAREEARAKEEAKANEEACQSKSSNGRFSHLKQIAQPEDGMTNDELEAIRQRNDFFQEAEAMRTGREEKLNQVEQCEVTLRQLKEQRLRAISEDRRRAVEDEKRRADEQAKQVAEQATRLRQLEEEGQMRAANEEVLRQMSNIYSPRVIQSSATVALPSGLQFSGHHHNSPQASLRSETSELLFQQAQAEAQARAPSMPSELEQYQQRLRAELQTNQEPVAKASRPVASLTALAQSVFPGAPAVKSAKSTSASSTKPTSVSTHSGSTVNSKSGSAAATGYSKPLSGNVKVSKAPSTIPQTPDSSSSDAALTRPKNSTFKGFVPAYTDAGRHVSTDMPFSSVSFPSENSVGTTATQPSPAINLPETLGSQPEVQDDMSGGQDLELGPPGIVSPAQQRANLRHLKLAHPRTELSAGGDRSIRSGPTDVSTPSVKQEENQDILAPPAALSSSHPVINESQQVTTTASQDAPFKRESSPTLRMTAPKRSIVPPPRPKMPVKKATEQTHSPVSSGPSELQQPLPVKARSPHPGASSHASSNPWNMDASTETLEWAPARSPPPTSDHSKSPVGVRSQQQAVGASDVFSRSETSGSRSNAQAEHLVLVKPSLPVRPHLDPVARRGYDHYSPPRDRISRSPVSPPRYWGPSVDRYVPSDIPGSLGGQSRKRPREDEDIIDDSNTPIRRRSDVYKPVNAASITDEATGWRPQGYGANARLHDRPRSPVSNLNKARTPPPPVRPRNVIYERERDHSSEAPVYDRQQRAATRGRAKKGVQGRKTSPHDTPFNISEEQLRQDNVVAFPQPQQEPIRLLERLGDFKEASQTGQYKHHHSSNRTKLPLADRLSTSAPKTLEERLG